MARMSRGSHATWGAYDSRVCIICGRPIRITTQACWMHTDDQTGAHRSSHVSCGSPLRRTEAVMTEEPTPEPQPESEPEPENGDDDEEADGDTDAG